MKHHLFESHIKKIDTALEDALNDMQNVPDILKEAMSYSLLGGGKRLRPLLLLITTEACGGDINKALSFACAVEMLHTYSLIHDDLPSMDNDDFRRGKPTSHLIFGESIAILAGDALLTEAWALMAKGAAKADWPASLIIKTISEMVYYAGVHGMVSGQVEDICSQLTNVEKIKENTIQENTIHEKVKYIDIKKICQDKERIYFKKTSSLFVLSARLGVYIAGGDEDILASLTQYATYVGLAFQVQDDILDGDVNIIPISKNDLYLKAERAIGHLCPHLLPTGLIDFIKLVIDRQN